MTDIEQIHNRNTRVDADKAWETSRTRRAMIAGLTYIVAYAYMDAIGAENVAVNALIPTGGFLLSTLSLRFVKQYWLKKIYQKNA